MRITRHRAIAAATAAAIALSSLAITPASAGPYRHYHRGAGNAAVLGAVAGVFGLIATLAARRHYERQYGYGGYGAYAPAPAPYGDHGGPRPYYGYGNFNKSRRLKRRSSRLGAADAPFSLRRSNSNT